MKNNILKIIKKVCNELDIPYVILGGLALPAYNVFRNTLDIDVSIYVTSQNQLDLFLVKMKEFGYKTLQKPKISHDLFVIFRPYSEAEIWLKPCDAFSWDEEMVKAIVKFSGYQFLSEEDYIATKLARMDRSNTDIQDIYQVLVNNEETLDWEYLKNRLRKIGLIQEFKDILEMLYVESDNDIKRDLSAILERIKKSF